jgi:hypothetical protein
VNSVMSLLGVRRTLRRRWPYDGSLIARKRLELRPGRRSHLAHGRPSSAKAKAHIQVGVRYIVSDSGFHPP